jgi:hypothetical protein
MATSTASEWKDLPGSILRDIVFRVNHGYKSDVASIRRTCKHWLVETGSGREYLLLKRVHASWDSPIFIGLKSLSMYHSYFCYESYLTVVSKNFQSPDTPIGPSVFKSLEELDVHSPPARNNVHQVLNALVPHGRIRSIKLDLAPFVTESQLSILGLLTSLTSLELRDVAQFTDANAEALASLTNLTSLRIEKYDIEETLMTDKGVAALCGLTGLTSLRLLTPGKGLTLASVPFISALTGLTDLELRVPDTDGRPVTDMVSTLGRLVRLRYLRLVYPVNVCLGVSALPGLPALEKLVVETGVITCVDTDRNIINPLARLAGFPVLESLAVKHNDCKIRDFVDDFVGNFRFSFCDDGDLPVVTFAKRILPLSSQRR